MWTIRRVDAVYRRWRADASPAHGGNDRVCEGTRRACLDEYERKHVWTNATATRKTRTTDQSRDRPDRVFDGRGRRRALRATPSASWRHDEAAAGVVGQASQQRACGA